MSSTCHRLLIVDPEATAGEALAALAERAGYDAVAVTSGTEFVRLYADLSPTMVCINLETEDRDGVELIRWLSDQDSEAKLLVTSGLDGKVLNTAANLAKARRLSVAGTIRKPFIHEEAAALLEMSKVETGPVTLRDIEKALGENEIVLRYQPKVSLSQTDALPLQGAEALVRWHHPERGLLAPDKFLPQVERFGLMGRLTDIVIDQAFTDLARWSELADGFSMAINIPGDLLDDLELPDKIEARARQAGVNPRQVVLEITESVAIEEEPVILDVLTRMRLKGFALALDDFGTGYSSLVELYRMPFSELKVDRSFVRQIESDEDARIIVRSIVGLAHNLGLKTCAEGVETQKAISILSEIGCEQAQGYYITVPLAAEAFESFVRRWGEKSLSLRVVSSNDRDKRGHAA